jgi:hypothetical protein
MNRLNDLPICWLFNGSRFAGVVARWVGRLVVWLIDRFVDGLAGLSAGFQSCRNW